MKGRWALWSAQATPCCFPFSLTRRDLVSGTNIVISTTAGNYSNDATPDGHAVFWDGPSPSGAFDIYQDDPDRPPRSHR